MQCSGHNQQPEALAPLVPLCSRLIAFCLLAAPAHAQSLHTANGIRLDVPSLEYTQEGWQATEGSGKEFSARVLRWGAFQGVLNQPAVWLADGSWLCGDLQFQESRFVVRSKWFAEVQLPLASLRGLVVQPIRSGRDWRVLKDWMESAKGADDQIRLLNGNTLAGVLALSSVDRRDIRFELTKGSRVDRWNSREVGAVVFSPALVGSLTPKHTSTALATSDGSLIQVDKMQVVNGRLELTTKSGLELKSIDSAKRFAKELRYVWRKDAGPRYLSDLPVAQYKYLQGSSSLKWELGVDRDCFNRPLATEQGTVPKGLAMHASSQVAFRWDGSPGRFRSELLFALPQNGGSSRLGNVRCKLLLARSGKLESSAEVVLDRVKNPRDMIDVDVTDAQLVVLVSEENQAGQLGDHVLWLDARIDRKQAVVLGK